MQASSPIPFSAMSNPISLFTYATWLLVLQQVSFILETFIFKELKQARTHAYEALIESRGKGQDFWISYQEEWKRPPIERAQRSMERVPFLMKANNRWFRMALSKCRSDFTIFPFKPDRTGSAFATASLHSIFRSRYPRRAKQRVSESCVRMCRILASVTE